MDNKTDNKTLAAVEQIRAIRNKIRVMLKHEERKLEKQRVEAEEAGQYARYGQIADSLMADPAGYPRGTAKTEVINVYTESIEEIALNPSFDAVENAELLYKKSRKGKRGHDTALKKKAETENKAEKLKAIIIGIEAILAEKEPQKIENEDLERATELSAEFLPPEKTGSGRRGMPPEPTLPFKKYIIDGWEVYLGKNSTQNDELSTKFAKPSDIWLHVAAHAGSHVIIRHKKNTDNPPKTVIEKAAQLAVWFSKAKHTSYAEVHVTEARFVRKRRHAPPGEVIAERCKAVRVEPKDPRLMFGDTED